MSGPQRLGRPATSPRCFTRDSTSTGGERYVSCDEQPRYRVYLNPCEVGSCRGQLICIGHLLCVRHAANMRSGKMRYNDTRTAVPVADIYLLTNDEWAAVGLGNPE